MRKCRLDGQFEAEIACDARGCTRHVCGYGRTKLFARTEAESAAYEYRWLKVDDRDYCEAHAYTRRQRPRRAKKEAAGE